MGSGRAVVIGAGAIGLSVAIELAELGRRVTVVDSGEPGSGTTGTSFAWINSNGKSPREYHELNLAGARAYRGLEARGAGREWLRLTGHIEWAESDDARQELERRQARLREWGYRIVGLTRHDIARMEPDVRSSAATEASFYPDEGHVFTVPFVQDQLRRARASGVTVMIGRSVTGFERRGDRVTGAILTDGTRLAADAVVACAGRWTEKLVGLAGVHVPMIPLTVGSRALGLLGYSTRVKARVGRVISSPGLNLRPGPGGGLILQAPDLDGLAIPGSSPAADGPEATELLRRAKRLLDGMDGASVESVRVGYRAIPLDGLTVAGWAPAADGLYVLATHSGITLALVLGALAAREIVTATEEPGLAPFRPARFAEGTVVLQTTVH